MSLFIYACALAQIYCNSDFWFMAFIKMEISRCRAVCGISGVISDFLSGMSLVEQVFVSVNRKSLAIIKAV